MTVDVFRSVLCREADVPDIGMDTPFADLSMDPLTLLSVLEEVEEATGVAVPASVFRDCTCLADLQRHLKKSCIPVRAAAAQTGHDVLAYARSAGVDDFWTAVYPDQQRLVVAYLVEALEQLGCALATTPAGGRLTSPATRVLPQHQQVLAAYLDLLEAEGLLEKSGDDYVRTTAALPDGSADALHAQLLAAHPQHANTHRLLHLTGPRLAACLTGEADPIRLLFGSATGRELLQHFYTQAPMSLAASAQLAALFKKAFAGRTECVQVLEVGAGFGGTTGFVLEALAALGVPYKYTFTDVSASFFKAARQRYAGHAIEFELLDIETTVGPPIHLQNRFDAVVSTNCIHATHDLAVSTNNARQMLRKDVDGAFLALVEFTERYFWLDCVFGLLDGWWRFTDGRRHCIADEPFWADSLTRAGFDHVAFTEGRVEGHKPDPQVILAWNGE